MASPYEHQPLILPNSIRVVTLEPAESSEAPIECSLDEVDLDNINRSSRYEALSYVWGERAGSIPVLCHGKQLLVTPNCHDALIRLRLPAERRRLFIDAICIDQRQGQPSVAERDRQIPLMGQVYEKSHRVLIWLGKSHPSTEALFEVMQLGYWLHCVRVSLGKGLFQAMRPSHWMRGIKVDKVNMTSFITLGRGMGFGQHDSAKLGEAYAHFAQNPWFTRLWTLQEQVFADEKTCVILYDHQQLEFKAFNASWDALGDLLRIPTDVPPGTFTLVKSRSIFSTIYMISRKANPNNLDTTKARLLLWPHLLLDSIGDLNSTIPQDKIFGIHGIFARAGLNLPLPDSSKTVVEVFEAATRAIIQQTGSLDVITLCARKDRVTEGLPSWVPDWSIKSPLKDMVALGGYDFQADAQYKATENTIAVASPAIDVGKLNCRGVIVGKVEFLAVSSTIGVREAHADPSVNQLPFQHFVEACVKWCQHVASSPTYPTYCTGCPTIEAVKRTLLLGYGGGVPDEVVNPKYWYRAFPMWFDLMLYPNCKINKPEVVDTFRDIVMIYMQRQNRNLDPDFGRDINPGVAAMSYVAIDNYLEAKNKHDSLWRWANYALMVLDTGHFARGLYVCQEGDVVALLANCDCPVALRPDGNGNYRFVAPLYVDGIMDGEAWPEDEAELKEIILV
ncbi:hypothetical protein NUW58_g4070 [Xylaria curta]|uniref:Uncharacterized protein n=1 Tax=Xylaria curta TaxID=42375 RepID=A0ACC1P852_9PEZI|nr:hypothetical protein NUW58_g4070 [Xylaria curta]